MNLVNMDRLFEELDEKVYNLLTESTILLKEMKDGMDNSGISIATMISRDRAVGEPLIEVLEKFSKFLTEYKELKDTWQLTTV